MRSWRKYPPTSQAYRTRCSSFNIQPRNAKASHHYPQDFATNLESGPKAPCRIGGSYLHYQDFELPAPPYLAKSNHIHVVSAEKDADGMFRRMIPAFLRRVAASFTPFARSSLARPPGSTGITVTGNQIQFHSEQKPPIQIRSSRMVRSDSIIIMWIVETETVSFANVIDWRSSSKGEVADRANSNLIRSPRQEK